MNYEIRIYKRIPNRVRIPLYNSLFSDSGVGLVPLAEEAAEIWGGHLGNFKIFLLQKLNSYGEP